MPPKPLWILIALLLVGGALAVWLLTDPDQAGIETTGSGQGTRTDPEARGIAEASRESSGATPSRPEVETSPFRETEEAQAPPDGIGARRVTLVDGVSEATLSRAVLHALPARIPGALELDPAALAAHPAAIKRVADRNGLTSIPGREAMVVVGIAGKLASEAVSIGPEATGTRLRLHAVQELRFRIVDADGIPRRGERLDVRISGPFLRTPLATAAADSEGRVVMSFPDLVKRWRTFDVLSSSIDRITLVARVSGLYAANPSAPIDLSDPPREEILIRLPATGRLVVRLEGPAEAVRSVRRVSVRLLQPGETVDPGAIVRKEVRGFASSRVENGVAVFNGIGVGTKLEVRVRPRKRGLDTVTERIDGPAEQDEEVFLRVALGQEKPRLAWRLCDPEGQPLRNLPFLKGQLDDGSDNPLANRQAQLSPDPEGRLTWSPPRPWIPGKTRTLAIEVPRGEVGGDRLHAVVDLSRRYAPGVTDLGDLILKPMKPIAAGRVLDGEGNPEEGVRVSVGSVVSLDDLDSPDAIGFRDALVTRALFDRSDEAGRFAIYGAWEHTTVCLHASKSGYMDFKTPTLSAHRRDLELHLQAGGRIAGRIILESPKWTREAVRLDLKPSEGESGDVDSFKPKSNGAFTSDDIAPGKWTLAIRWRNRLDPIRKVENLEVKAGETLRDPRLEHIDLRGKIRQLAILVVDDSGKPLRYARISVDRAGPDGASGNRRGFWHWVTTTDQTGRGTILSPDSRERVLVTLDGYRDQTLILGATGARVTLLPEGGQDGDR